MARDLYVMLQLDSLCEKNAWEFCTPRTNRCVRATPAHFRSTQHMSRNTNFRLCNAALACAGLLLADGVALAQEQRSALELEEIIVTARKRVGDGAGSAAEHPGVHGRADRAARHPGFRRPCQVQLGPELLHQHVSRQFRRHLDPRHEPGLRDARQPPRPGHGFPGRGAAGRFAVDLRRRGPRAHRDREGPPVRAVRPCDLRRRHQHDHHDPGQ